MNRRLVGAAEFGRSLSPPRHKNSIIKLCKSGRVVGAIKPNTEWLIPEGAKVKGAGQRLDYGTNTGLSASEYARLHGRSRSRVYKLLNQGRIEGATHGPHGWDVPPDAPWPADDGF